MPVKFKKGNTANGCCVRRNHHVALQLKPESRRPVELGLLHRPPAHAGTLAAFSRDTTERRGGAHEDEEEPTKTKRSPRRRRGAHHITRHREARLLKSGM
ncbi:hypothetical protein EYF80_058419 [Liparis tanakae]|uniref:Uncharacterized protein n=1 Tax=Liparis tanakae TaxID=230148 RepID=A0A4Z2ET12_9TELE|nr:hypothetical protein EYF80_058419 [Liparis tanakae]